MNGLHILLVRSRKLLYSSILNTDIRSHFTVLPISQLSHIKLTFQFLKDGAFLLSSRVSYIMASKLRASFTYRADIIV